MIITIRNENTDLHWFYKNGFENKNMENSRKLYRLYIYIRQN